MTSIEIQGLHRTHFEVVWRELELTIGEPATDAGLEADRLRLLDLGLFSRVESVTRTDSLGGVAVTHSVRERPTLLALPIVELDDEDELIYGGRVQDGNFRGRNEDLGVTVRWGAERSGSLFYAAPWVAGHRLRVSTLGFASEQPKRTERIQDRRTGVALGFAPGPSRERGIGFGAGIEQVDTEPLDPEEDDPPPEEHDDHRWLDVGVFRDTRLYRARPRQGHRVGASVSRHGGPLGGDTDFWRAQIDLLGVVPTGGSSGLTIATRAVFSESDVPRYLRLALGGSGTLRGHASGAYGGDSRWIGWVEQQFPLLPSWRFSLPRDWGEADVTVDGALFFDFGAIWDGNDLAKRRARGRAGGGAGLRILIPFVEVFRLDVATDGEAVRFDSSAGMRL